MRFLEPRYSRLPLRSHPQLRTLRGCRGAGQTPDNFPMQGASTYGLERMPNVEPSVAALILSPDEALRPHARCPAHNAG